ncbi:MHYT domain-containing protein [Streptomyces sp. TS71-3]|uniref:MHYT domain-containing protein n=1 Tax=Streptomyces sp. TS71-3 TaxID=2733862 RepID=UPI001B20F082|nr:MHYT domain-containing protein [Streptomyces sp. TS71-3]GHJ38332.1 membrane protein [Streptomyces sp. TS71-3]
MYAKVDGFSYGLLTPLAAFVAACTGGALGLRGLTRALRTVQPGRAGWLALSSAAFGTSVWITHFIAMMGFAVAHAPLDYDLLVAFAGLGVAIVMVGAGIFIAAYRGMTGRAVFTGGTVTGLGIASTHYMGMAGLRLDGHLEYNTLTVAASVLIAVVAATGAFWVVGQGRGTRWNAAAGLVMGLAMLGMHYTGMSAVRVHLYAPAAGASAGSPVRELTLMLIGPVAFLLVLAVILLATPGRAAPLPLRAFGTSRLPVLPTQRSGGPESARVRSRTPQNR